MLWDEKQQLFVAVRDRYGIKPLFWTVQNGRLLVAAEQKAFLPLGWEPEWDVRALRDAGWNHDTRTLFKEVQKVSPFSRVEAGIEDLDAYVLLVGCPAAWV